MRNNHLTENPTGFVDVHTHVLPGVDDGARNLKESVELLKLSYGQGFKKIIVTPHYAPHHSRVTAEDILSRTQELREAVGEHCPEMEIYSGQEIFYFDGIVRALRSGRVLTLAGTDCVLIEFSPDVPYAKLFRAVRSLVMERYVPVLAHVERYRCLRQAGRVEELIHTGAYMQMNYSSLTAKHGLAKRRRCRKMVLSGEIHLLGTDMHRLDYRPPETKKAAGWLQKKAGSGMLERLAVQNAGRLLAGELL